MFYQSVHYEALRDRLVHRGPLGANIGFSDRSPAFRDCIYSYFDELVPERVGILHGEYVVLESGLMLADRKGVLTGGCLSLEHPYAADSMANFCARPDFIARLEELIRQWDTLPVQHNTPILADPYNENYYHFSLEMVPRMRHFAPGPQTTLMMQHGSLVHAFQRDLLVRTLDGRICQPLIQPVRVCDPILAHDGMTNEGLYWLRRSSRITAQPGDRRIYIRRSGRGTRSNYGGGISDTLEFHKLLEDFAFETIEFGNGERDVTEQVAMLDGAGLILSPHGAALTNLAYLNPPLTLIEAIGAQTPRGCFMHLAAALGFTYHGINSNFVDVRGDIALGLDELRDILHTHTRPRR